MFPQRAQHTATHAQIQRSFDLLKKHRSAAYEYRKTVGAFGPNMVATYSGASDLLEAGFFEMFKVRSKFGER